jgi:hypothetical protein
MFQVLGMDFAASALLTWELIRKCLEKSYQAEIDSHSI